MKRLSILLLVTILLFLPTVQGLCETCDHLYYKAEVTDTVITVVPQGAEQPVALVKVLYRCIRCQDVREDIYAPVYTLDELLDAGSCSVQMEGMTATQERCEHYYYCQEESHRYFCVRCNHAITIISP